MPILVYTSDVSYTPYTVVYLSIKGIVSALASNAVLEVRRYYNNRYDIVHALDRGLYATDVMWFTYLYIFIFVMNIFVF